MNTDNLVLASMAMLVSSMNIQRYYEKKRLPNLLFGIAYAVTSVLYFVQMFRDKNKN